MYSIGQLLDGRISQSRGIEYVQNEGDTKYRRI